jgi:hypothetical protein
MSATYLEPSILAMHFLGLFALFALGLRRWILGGAILLCLLVSTSATAYVGLVALGALWLVLQIYDLDLKRLSTWSTTVAILAGVLLSCAALFDELPGYHFIMQKLSSHSGSVRSAADLQGIRTFFESWGLGVGIGSTRSSSFLPTFAACLGMPGLICLFGFFTTLTRACVRSGSRETRALALGLTALGIGWSIAVPDLTVALVWLFAGIAHGSLEHPTGAQGAAECALRHLREPATPLRQALAPSGGGAG